MSINRIIVTIFVVLFVAFISYTQASESNTIYYFDVSQSIHFDCDDAVQVRKFWDTLHLIVSVQGIVNKDREVLFVRTKPKTDDFWWNYLRQEGNWLAGRPVVEIESLDQLLKIFASKIKRPVVYSEKPWSLSNVASTVAGIEGRVALRFDGAPDSVYQKVMQGKYEFDKSEKALFLCDSTTGESIFTGEKDKPLPVLTELDRTSEPLLSTGSAKCDAYLWAKRNYLDTGRAAKKDHAFYLDAFWLEKPKVSEAWNNTLVNHDYCISKGGFFFDLHCWRDEAPVDDPKQPIGTDFSTLTAILKAMFKNSDENVYEIHGFTPWAWKYTSFMEAGSKYEPVTTEWEKIRVFSVYNAYVDADALGFSALANCSFYRHFPMKDHYPQHERPTLQTLEKRGLIKDGKVVPRSYVMIFMGDYDSAAWLAIHVPEFFNDPQRGSIPCNWPFNPNLEHRVPQVMDYVRKNATKNDWFMTGDSGAGYLNPGMLTAPRTDRSMPDGWEAWSEHNKYFYKKYDLDITGFVIDGRAPGMGDVGLKRYAEFSPVGMIGHKIPDQQLPFGMPTIGMRGDYYGTPAEAAKVLENQYLSKRETNQSQFLPIRTILKSPTWHKEFMEVVIKQHGEENVCFVDVYTFFLLLKKDIENR